MVADTVPSVHAATGNALRRNNVRKSVTFENPEIPPTNLNPSMTYIHHSIVVGGVQGYWSWEIDDYSKPLHKSQVDHQHRPGRPPRVAVDVTSQKSIESMRQASLMAQVAAFQNGISLSEGKGLMYEWDEGASKVYATEPYEGSLGTRTNEVSKRPLLWSRRHCRIYNDPMCGSFEQVNPAYFEVVNLEHGRPHPEFDDYLHMVSVPGEMR